MEFIISETDEVLVPQAGLAVVGALLKGTAIKRRTSAIALEDCPRPEIKHGEVVTAAIGLLCLGKSDYTDIEAFRHDEFFRRALGLGKVPSQETLRQRLDQLGTRGQAILHEESAALVKQHVRKLSCCYGEWVPLDVDVSPFDNSGTKKEGVSWTYQGMDGYAPNFAYLGVEGFEVHCELRPGKQHCQDGTPEFLDTALRYAEQITSQKILVRMDAGNDDFENVRVCRKHKADWIIKRNLRKESLEEWLEEAQAYGDWEFPREGKEVYTGQTWRQRDGKEYRVVFEVTYRTIDAKGQRLLVPEIEVNTWWTSLKVPAKEVIALYHAHGTSEQYHSEIKTDLDLERLPSGKFATNALVLSLGMVAYNLLRLIGQQALREQKRLPAAEQAPLPEGIVRRRLRSVIQDLMYLAAKLWHHSNRWGLALWQNSPWRGVWRRVYARFCGVAVVRSG
jgi:Transposase DDE domain group 1